MVETDEKVSEEQAEANELRRLVALARLAGEREAEVAALKADAKHAEEERQRVMKAASDKLREAKMALARASMALGESQAAVGSIVHKTFSREFITKRDAIGYAFRQAEQNYQKRNDDFRRAKRVFAAREKGMSKEEVERERRKVDQYAQAAVTAAQTVENITRERDRIEREFRAKLDEVLSA